MVIFQTGQRRCYDSEGRVVDCNGTGQDGEYRSGLPCIEKNRFAETEPGIVQDRQTGLLWSRNASPNVFPQSWQEALDYVKELNGQKFLGYDDWRMPNRRELRSVLFLEAMNPVLTPDHPFRDVFHGWYWTSTTAAINPRYAWYVHLGGARMFYGRKDQQCLLWPVRGRSEMVLATGQEACFDSEGRSIECAGTGQDGEFRYGVPHGSDRFVIEGDLVVKDRLTGLSWTRNADLASGTTTWEGALNLVRRMNETGYGSFIDWRLPNINELESLVDCSCHSPALSARSPFERVREFYWSSTTSFYDPPWAWALYMKKGAVGVGLKRLENFFVWAVRG